MSCRLQVHDVFVDCETRFRTRCKVIADQADLRELHFKTILRHKDAEIANLAAKHEVERKKADAEAARCRTLTNQVSTFSHTEAELRSQLNIYVEKFKQVCSHSRNSIKVPLLRFRLTTQQVEDTLNNSNELFLTFRKEMEEMSKKTKRLEKENLTLTRKHDQTNRNILEMAEERTRDKEELEKLHKKETQMRSIIQSMREQGRGTVPPPELDEEGTESEYDEEYEDDEEDDDEEGSFDGEDELPSGPAKPIFGPAPPPPTPAESRTNGTRPTVNGIKH